MSILSLFKHSALVILLLRLSACHQDTAINQEEQTSTTTFYTGADVSWLTEMESNGHQFYDNSGQLCDCMALLKSYGLQAIRLRVWVNPSEHGNWCNSSDVLKKALRAKAQHLDIMVDFHYSDWWADPSKQHIPIAWKAHHYEQLKNDVAQHTREVLQQLKDHGIVPRWVQVGNETSNGFLWPVGQADIHPEQYAGLFKAGYEAAKSVFPQTQVIVHLDNGPDENLYAWNLGLLHQAGAQWDLIGMSVYPYWSMQSGKFVSADEVIEKSVAHIRKLYRQYGTEVIVVETGFECADAQGHLGSLAQLKESKRQLTQLLQLCRNETEGHCRGVFYWEPQCTPSQYRLGAFTANGQPTIIMDAFRTK